jgi:hypothetical protein
MIQTWSSGPGGEATCKKCGSVYSVTIYRAPARDSDSFNCEVCGHLMRKWNDTRIPSFTLKKAGKKPNESDT